jgi:hypothetical protein
VRNVRNVGYVRNDGTWGMRDGYTSSTTYLTYLTYLTFLTFLT